MDEQSREVGLKKWGLIVAVLVAAAAIGYWLWTEYGGVTESEETLTNTINPFKEEANPFEKAPVNPYEDVKVNPFE